MHFERTMKQKEYFEFTDNLMDSLLIGGVHDMIAAISGISSSDIKLRREQAAGSRLHRQVELRKALLE